MVEAGFILSPFSTACGLGVQDVPQTFRPYDNYHALVKQQDGSGALTASREHNALMQPLTPSGYVENAFSMGVENVPQRSGPDGSHAPQNHQTRLMSMKQQTKKRHLMAAQEQNPITSPAISSRSRKNVARGMSKLQPDTSSADHVQKSFWLGLDRDLPWDTELDLYSEMTPASSGHMISRPGTAMHRRISRTTEKLKEAHESQEFDTNEERRALSSIPDLPCARSSARPINKRGVPRRSRHYLDASLAPALFNRPFGLDNARQEGNIHKHTSTPLPTSNPYGELEGPWAVHGNRRVSRSDKERPSPRPVGPRRPASQALSSQENVEDRMVNEDTSIDVGSIQVDEETDLALAMRPKRYGRTQRNNYNVEISDRIVGTRTPGMPQSKPFKLSRSTRAMSCC